MRRKTITLALLSIVLVLSMGMGSAWAYFTDSSMATGGLVIEEPTTTLTEEYGPTTKDIVITNTSETNAVWVRARAYISRDLKPGASGANWSGSIDTWYTYDVPLEAGKQTEPLHIEFGFTQKTPMDPIGTNSVDGDVYNVVVVYECVPVTYGANGDVMANPWN